ncbi:MAG TPA: M3 family metallopeptidase [Cyclobacteriaceae bacterium]
MNNISENPLINDFETPFQAPPFEEIKNKHFEVAIDRAIQIAQKNIDDITNNPEKPTIENTLVPLDLCDDKLNNVAAILFNLNSAETNDELQKIAQNVSPRLSDFYNDLYHNETLFERVKELYTAHDLKSLESEDEMMLDKTYKAFIRSGANLNDNDKKRYKEVTKELSELSLKFGENLLKETNKYEMVLEKEDLDGLPEYLINAASESAKSKKKPGKYIITLHAPSYVPFMQYSRRRDLREKLYKAFMSKSFKNDELDNQEIIKKIVRLRKEQANILGYKKYADFVLEERMVKSAEKVSAFLNELLDVSRVKAEKEVLELKDFIKASGENIELQRWDWAFYSEKLKKAKFDLNDEMLKPYFKIDFVIDGVFKVAGLLYGLHFKLVNNIPKYHKDAKAYEVVDEMNKHVALLYVDFYPREGKRGGAWMTTYREQHVAENNDIRPIVSIVGNFSQPTEKTPSLLTFEEVKTLFHEFGHALHSMLSRCKYKSLSGTNVYWDFVELPSQIMENWCFEKDCLDLFAKNYETNENIPNELIDRIKNSMQYHEAYATIRQISFGLLDMGWHNQENSEITDVDKMEKEFMSSTELFPRVENTNMSTQFGHIFAGGYAAGYYSYKWAEVLDADAFEAFKKNGIFNKKIAEKFRLEILSKGGTEHPSVLYKKFKGKEPSIQPLLKRAGLK